MKPEKEFKYMMILLSSDSAKDWLDLKFPTPSSKKDLEILCGVWEKDKEFYLWLNELIAEGSLVFSKKDKTDKNYTVKKYIVKSRVLKRRFKNHPLYQYAKDCFLFEK